MLRGEKIAALLSAMLIAFNSVTADSVKPNGCKGAVLCPTFPIIGNLEDCGYTWHVDLGLLYQQPGFSGMSPGTAYKPVFQEGTTYATFQDQTITNLQECFDYSLGLTVSLGHLIKHDDWFALARFDWMNSNKTKTYDDTDSFFGPNQHFNYDVMAGTTWDTDTNYFTEIDYSASISIYALDVLLSRGSYHSKCFSYEPFMGVKALWYNGGQTINYFGSIASGQPLANGNVPSLNQAQNNWGAGPMFGFNGEYHITNGLSLFTNSDIAILYGQSENNFTSSLSAAGSTIITDNTVTNRTKNECQYYVPIRSIIGIKLDSYCLEDAHYVAIKLGYDVRAILTTPILTSAVANHAEGPINSIISNDLFMSGLYCNLEWDF